MKVLESVAHLSTIIASVVAITALGLGSLQFEKTQELARETLQAEREAKAVELYVKFNELKESAVAEVKTLDGEAGYWRNNSLLTITESVSNLTDGNASWNETIRWMLELQQPFLASEPLICNTFSAEFRAMLENLPGLHCTEK